MAHVYGTYVMHNNQENQFQQEYGYQQAELEQPPMDFTSAMAE